RFTIANPKFSFPDISGTPEKEINLPGRRGQSRSRNIPPEIKSARTEIREIKSTQKIRKSKYPRPQKKQHEIFTGNLVGFPTRSTSRDFPRRQSEASRSEARREERAPG